MTRITLIKEFLAEDKALIAGLGFYGIRNLSVVRAFPR
jgi:hypothetical protein